MSRHCMRSLRRKRNRLLKKGIVFLPHLFTLCNAFFGFCSLVLASQKEWEASAHFIFLAALMDALDGRIARFIGSQTAIGMQLDSLCDVISFCVAPAFLVFCRYGAKFGMLGLLASGIFVLAGLIRLARFSVFPEQQTLYFFGLPTTMAGCFLAALLLNISREMRQGWVHAAMLIIMCILAGIMISSIPFPTGKQKLFRLEKRWQLVSYLVMFVAFSAIFRLDLILLLFFGAYFTLSLVVAWYK